MYKAKINFSTKTKGKSLFIEGFGNANVFDRGKERIDPKGWKLDNYVKNPVILYDHGKDKVFGSFPVGTATKVEAQDGGLFIKAKILESDHQNIVMLRDAIEQGILKTFSVGFDPKSSAIRADEGIVIPEAELVECSIVPVPMNQDSIFSLSEKSFKNQATQEYFLKLKSVHDLYSKGAVHAAVIAHELIRNDFDFATFVSMLKENGINEQRAFNILDGNIKNISDIELKKFEEILKIKFTEIDEIIIKGDTMEDGKEKPKPCEKEIGFDMSAAMEEMGKECHATATDGEGNPPAWVGDEAAWAKAKEAADQSYSRDDAQKYWAVVAWLYLNRFGGSVKQTEKPQPSEQSGESADSKGKDAEKEKTQTPSGDNAVKADDNPYLDLMKQSNIIAATSLGVMQQILEKMSYLVAKPAESDEENPAPTEPPKPETEETIEETEKKLIAEIRKNNDDLKKRLSVLT